MPLREAALLARYHLRVLGRAPLLLILLGFLGFAILLWFQAHDLRIGLELSLFVLEPFAALIAAMIGSALIINDPDLELLITTRTELVTLVIWRWLLSFIPLLICSTTFLIWSLANGIEYTASKIPLIWLAPVLVMSMLGLLGSLLTRSATLGMTLAALPWAGSLFLSTPLAQWLATHWFFISETYSEGPNSPHWWMNRLTLLGCTLIFAVWNGWLLRREERLVR
jgi:hypothetical protein